MLLKLLHYLVFLYVRNVHSVCHIVITSSVLPSQKRRRRPNKGSYLNDKYESPPNSGRLGGTRSFLDTGTVTVSSTCES